MTPTHRVARAAVVLLVAVAGGVTACEQRARRPEASERSPASAPRAASAAAPTARSLRVVQADVVLRVEADFIVGAVPFVYENPGASPVANPGCDPPSPPRLQWWDGQRWQQAFDAASNACASPPFIVPPGGRFVDTLELRVPTDSVDRDGGTRSAWRAPRGGASFRLVWNLYEVRGDARAGEDGPTLPESERTSAPFRLVVQPAFAP